MMERQEELRHDHFGDSAAIAWRWRLWHRHDATFVTFAHREKGGDQAAQSSRLVGSRSQDTKTIETIDCDARCVPRRASGTSGGLLQVDKSRISSLPTEAVRETKRRSEGPQRGDGLFFGALHASASHWAKSGCVESK
jgi:hypothetical protein